MSCRQISSCCQCCISSSDEEPNNDECEKDLIKKKGSYSQVPNRSDDYDQFSQDIILPEFNKVPLDKVFQFTQPQIPLSIHPQIRKQSLIGEQPTSFIPITVGPQSRRPSLFEESSFCYSPLSSSASPQRFTFQVQLPRLNFSILYDIQAYSLTIHLLSAENLPPKDRKGTSDPFVNLFLLPHREDIFRSKTCYKQLNPIFNETFVFQNIPYNEVNDRTLVLRVLDENRISQNNAIGNVIIPLRKTELHGVQVSAVLNEDDETQQTSTNGDIQLILRYDPSIREISGLIIKASNLKKMDVTGSSDPYVEIKLYNKGKRINKWKSKVKKKTLIPVFNQDFTFDLSGLDLRDIVMKLVMKDEDLFSKDDFMGMVEFGEYVDHPTGRIHWKEIMNNPNTRITRWHSLDQHSVGIFHLLTFSGTRKAH